MNDGTSRVNRDAGIGKLSGGSTIALRLNAVVKWSVIGIVALVFAIFSIWLAISVSKGGGISLSWFKGRTQVQPITHTYMLTSDWQTCNVSGYRIEVEIYRRSTRILTRVNNSAPFEVPFHSNAGLGDNVTNTAWMLYPGEQGPVKVVCKLTPL